MKFLFLISILFFFNCVRAEKTYKVYLCEDESSAFKCLKSCKQVEGVNLKFNINKNSIIQTWISSKETNERVIKDCTIFDKENWICDNTKNQGEFKEIEIYNMTKGIHTQAAFITIRNNQGSSRVGKISLGKPSCAK